MVINYRKILAKNVDALKKVTPALNSNSKIAKACSAPNRKIGARTIGHLLNDDPDAPQPQLDTIVAVAEAFRTTPAAILSPDFDPDIRGIGEPIPTVIMDLARNIYNLSREKPELLENLGLTSEAVPDEEIEAHGYRAPGSPEPAKPAKKPARQLKMKLAR